MIYLIGGAPRCGKSTLCQRFAAELGIGWISTDLVVEVIDQAGIKKPQQWDARPEVVRDCADQFFPYFERIVSGINSTAESYVIEGVHFLPNHVRTLHERFPIRAVFLGCSLITPADIARLPGKSPGYADLPKPMRAQIARDVPVWSAWIQELSGASGFPYVDMAKNKFASSLELAAAELGDL